MNEDSKAYVKAVECWLKKQDIDKQRNIQDIELIRKQMILDDEVTRLSIINFNMWADENNAERIKPFNTIGEDEAIYIDANGNESIKPKHSKQGIGSFYIDIETKGYDKAKQKLRNLEATYDRILEKQERVEPISSNTKDHELLNRIDTYCGKIVRELGCKTRRDGR